MSLYNVHQGECESDIKEPITTNTFFTRFQSWYCMEQTTTKNLFLFKIAIFMNFLRTSDAPINRNWPWDVLNSCSTRYHLMYAAKNLIGSYYSRQASITVPTLHSWYPWIMSKSATPRFFQLVLQLHNGFLYGNFSRKFINNCIFNQKQVWSKCINIFLD